MHSQLHHLIADERIADLRRAAAGAREPSSTSQPERGLPEVISIRRAGEADRDALLRLAALDSARRPLAGDVLIARVGDEPRAALELGTGATVADPFRHTAHVVELLKLRAEGLRPQPAPRRLPQLRRRVAVPATR